VAELGSFAREDQSAAVVAGEKLKIKRESAKSRVQEGDVGDERSIYAGARDRQMELRGRWRRYTQMGGALNPAGATACSRLPKDNV
jgi:hypothetical protein